MAVSARNEHFGSSSRSVVGVVLAVAALVALGLSGAPLAAQAETGGGATSYSFESDAVGSVPIGCTTPAGRASATVSDAQAYDGTHSLEVHDTSTSTVVVTTCQNASQQGGVMSVEVFPVVASGLMIDVDGTTQTFHSVDNGAVFHLRVESNGALAWYDGSTWQALAPAGTAPEGEWSRVQIAVPTDNSKAYVGVNGVDYGAAGPAQGANNPITSITGFGFASLGASANTDNGFFDDVTFGPQNFTTGVTDGFESDAVGSVPTGCSTPVGSVMPKVTDTRAYAGQHSVEVIDTNSAAQAVLNCSSPKQNGAYLAMEINPVALAQGLIIDINGDALAPLAFDDSAAFHLWLHPDGSIQWNDGVNWRSLAPARAVPVGTWSLLQFVVPADMSAGNNTVHATVNGGYVGSGGPTIGNNHTTYRALTDITGFEIRTDSVAGTGDDVFLDNLEFGAASEATASATATPPLRIGPTSTMIDTGLAQDPSAAVVVPHDGGNRILATYTGHPDNSSTSGTGLFYSDDGGQSWVNDQQANPMPNSSEFFMTLLRNGDILAVGYHTFMTPNSNNDQAEVDTAVSHDDGATWTLHDGTMTTPEPMHTIAAGSTLGGFVLVHSVVEDSDGTLYQSGYGYYASDKRYRQILLVSRDEGQTWTVRSTVAVGDVVDPSGPTDGIAEGSLERVADGSLLMILRNGSYQPMSYTRSTDNGFTWSAPKQIEIGPQKQPLYSIFPTLQLLPSGQLVLLAGRPGLVITVSADGLGDDWSTPVGLDYVDSENAVFTALSPSSIIVLGDQGNVSPWRIWSRTVNIDQPSPSPARSTPAP